MLIPKLLWQNDWKAKALKIGAKKKGIPFETAMSLLKEPGDAPSSSGKPD